MDKNLDGNPQGKDALQGNQPGQPSDQNGENPSNQPRTFTEEEVNRLVSERHSTLDRKIADLTKQLTTFQKRAEDAESQLGTYKKEKEEAEIEKIKDDPEKLSAYQLRKQARELAEAKKGLEEQLAQLQSELEEERKLSAPLKVAPVIAEVAKEFEGIDMDKLTKLVTIAKATTKEDIKVIAETIGTKKEEDKSDDKPEFKPFTGANRGGGVDTSKLKPEEKFKLGLEVEQRNKK